MIASEDTDGSARTADTAAVVFALTLPTLIAWLYFAALRRDPEWVQQAAYALGKTTQFAFPVLWLLLVRRRRRASQPRPSASHRSWPAFRLRPGTGVAPGVAFGLFVVLAVLVAYHGWLEPAGLFEERGAAIRDRMTGFGIETVGAYVVVAVFYSLVHSFLEEYYWRWFVFGGLRSLMGAGPAILVSSIGFMTHHVIVLSVYFGWFTGTAVLFSLAVAAGGAVWAWIYHRSGSLAGAWISHLLADVAVFAIGFDVVRPVLGA